MAGSVSRLRFCAAKVRATVAAQVGLHNVPGALRFPVLGHLRLVRAMQSYAHHVGFLGTALGRSMLHPEQLEQLQVCPGAQGCGRE